MELKYKHVEQHQLTMNSFNCTFMELKCCCVIEFSNSWGVLIVPLWN